MKKRYHFYIVASILLISLLIGSLPIHGVALDLQINEAIFDRNNIFGLIVSSFGMIPGYGCLALLGGALFSISFKNKDFKVWLRIIFYVLSVAMFGISVYFLGKDVFSINGFYNPELHKWLGYLIMFVIMVPVFVGGFFLGKKNENPKMWIIILVLAAAIFMALVPGVTLFKSIMHRPRYRIAIHEYGVDFHNWWEPCKDYKDIINAHPDVLTKEEFKSFPSGHSGAAMVGLITMMVMPLLNKKWMKHQTLMFYIAFGWGLVVMFSRMLVGAHFLTDTCMGALLTIVFFFIANEIIVKKLLPNEEEKASE